MIAIQDALERGALHGPCTHWLTGVWRHTIGRTVRRTLALPEGVRVVAIGGATLGGSGKTPVAIACAVELAAAGARTVVVGHAYRAKPERARVVSIADSIEEVGDEALITARALDPVGARVVVAPTRASALAFAARKADVIVLDGIAQAAPVRATLALLSLDAGEPWGRAHAMPPCGDMRAPKTALLEACDALVPVMDDRGTPLRLGCDGVDRDVWPARIVCRGAWNASGSLLTWEALRSVRIGLLTALARPERVLVMLARRGVRPRSVLRGRDHGPIAADAAIHAEERRSEPRTAGSRKPDDGPRGERIDLWLATPKCALHAQNARLGAPLATLDHSVVLHPLLCARLRALALP